MSDATPGFFCAESAKQSEEALAGTASGFRFLFLLEYDRPWSSPRALEGSSIDAEIRDYVTRSIAELRGSRLLLIRNGRQPDGGIHLYAAVNREVDPYVNRFRLGGYEEVRRMHFADLVRRDAEVEVDHPLWLVCTHGKRDKCCAKFGMPIYKSLARRLPEEQVWQCSHVGGDRFAASVVTLPGCAYYGHVQEEDLDGLVARTTSGELFLPKLRGRACYPPAAQAADHFLRSETGTTGLESFRVVGMRSDDAEGLVGVRFEGPGEGARHDVYLKWSWSASARKLSCDASRTSRVRRYELVKIDRSDGATAS